MKREKRFTPLLKEGRGFTLIELMVVVVILAVLAGLALPKYMNEKKRSQESACWDDIDGMGTALESYFLSKFPNRYPDTLDILQTHSPPFIRFKRDYDTDGFPDTPWSTPGTPENYGYASWSSGYSLWVSTSYDDAKTAVYMNKGLQFRYP